jgi:hypothetical protein
VFATDPLLDITTCTGITQLVDACVQKMPRDHDAPDGDDRISVSSAPIAPDHGKYRLVSRQSDSPDGIEFLILYP